MNDNGNLKRDELRESWIDSLLISVSRQTSVLECSALRSAVRQHFMATFVHADFVSILMQFDDDRDGKLQPIEAPPRP